METALGRITKTAILCNRRGKNKFETRVFRAFGRCYIDDDGYPHIASYADAGQMHKGTRALADVVLTEEQATRTSLFKIERKKLRRTVYRVGVVYLAECAEHPSLFVGVENSLGETVAYAAITPSL